MKKILILTLLVMVSSNIVFAQRPSSMCGTCRKNYKGAEKLNECLKMYNCKK